MDWSGKQVLVTGGASFIGSHLTAALVDRGAAVRVVDNLSSGRRENLGDLLARGAAELVVGDLREPAVAGGAVAGVEVVFHLAADHGGRGYIETHQSSCSTNMVLDGNVFRAAAEAGVAKVVFASSACVYPEQLMGDPGETLFLREEMVGPPYCPDSLYGWAKLMGELVLRAYCAEGRLAGAVVRYFPVYGPRCPESHAVIAWIARAFVGEDPFEVWGTGEQVRNWTYVTDVVAATIAAAERIDDGRALNVGAKERTRVIDAVRMVLAMMAAQPRLTFDPTKPTGPYNRSCDDRLARELLGWQPTVPLEEGLRRTIEWYVGSHDRERVAATLGTRLLERA